MKSKSFHTFTQVIEYIIKYFKGIVSAAVILVAVSGVYRVESNEAAIVLRFGQIVGNTSEEQVKKPGLHFSLPFFIDEVVKIPVGTVHEKEIITHYNEGVYQKVDFIPEYVENSRYLLTGDNNVVLIKAIVKYRIEDAALYALYLINPEEMIDSIVSGEFTHSVTHMDIDYVLAGGKKELSSQVLKSSQAILDGLRTGITIVGLELAEVIPPLEALSFFEMVITASVNKETRIQTARENASTAIYRAEAEAKAYRQNSITAQADKLTKVRNEMAEFNGLYDQYVIDPQIIKAGIFRQRVNAVLTKAGGSVIAPEGGEPTVLIMP